LTYRSPGAGLACARAGRRVGGRQAAGYGGDRGSTFPGRRAALPTATKSSMPISKGRREKLGRDRAKGRFLPGAFVVVGDSVGKHARNAPGWQHGDIRQRHRLVSVSWGPDGIGLRSRLGSCADPGTTQCPKRGGASGWSMFAAATSSRPPARAAVGGYAGWRLSARPRWIADHMEEG